MILHVGSEDTCWEGVINLDKYAAECDVRADMCALPFADNVFKEIHSNHTLEHVAAGEAGQAMGEFYRVLDRRGKVYISVPDLEEVAYLYWARPSERDFWRKRIYGRQDHAGDFHKYGYDKRSLTTLMEETGFKTLRVEILRKIRPTPTIYYVGEKPRT